MARVCSTQWQEWEASDSHAGYHRFHCEESQEEYGSFEVYFQRPEPGRVDEWLNPVEPGWYWVACFPGCMPDGDPVGPFSSSQLAHEDADEWSPEYDHHFEE